VATAAAVVNVGAKPVFVDVLEDEYTMDPNIVEEKISGRTRAIIPVHLYGLPARMDEIRSIADRYELKIIEDAAQAHGAHLGEHKVGTFGQLAIFSFYPSKILGAMGDGGCIVTADSYLAEKLRRLRNHGQLHKHDHKLVGRNSRLDTLQAAVLLAKLSHIDTWLGERRQIARMYRQHLESWCIPEPPAGYSHAYHLMVIRALDREEVTDRLSAAQIGYGIHYPLGLPFMTCFGGASRRDYPVVAKLQNQVLSLPMYPGLCEEEVARVCQTIRQ
jgi:dTDP-4-amino-4,6-dideoxygalactose transaminase